MKRTLFPLLIWSVLLAGAAVAQERGERPIDPSPPKGITVDEIIRRFAAKESEFKEAREQYTWRQTVRVITPDDGGEYQQVVDILFDDKGRRTENVVFAPQPTLERVQMTPQDHEDIEKLLPFVLTTEELPEYNVNYLGQQRVDELDTYVFEISPRKIEKNRRYFDGRIWVDNQDFQIVMTRGKSVPDIRKGRENLFPRFTTWREQVDGRYWFPTYTRADDTLQFSGGPVRIRIIVKYTDYKRFGAKTRITYGGQEVEKADPNKPEQPPQQQPPK